MVKYVTISDRFICFINDSETISGIGGDDLKRSSNFFMKKVRPRENPGYPLDFG